MDKNELAKCWKLFSVLHHRRNGYICPEWLVNWKPDYNYHCPRFLVADKFYTQIVPEVKVIDRDGE